MIPFFLDPAQSPSGDRLARRPLPRGDEVPRDYPLTVALTLLSPWLVPPFRFSWPDGTDHNLFVMDSRASYDSCSFGRSTEVNVDQPIVYTLTSAKTYYFGCEVPGHCQYGGQKVAVTALPGEQ